MNKEEAIKKARQLLEKGGTDVSKMTDAEVMAKIKEMWEILKSQVEEITEWLTSDEMSLAFNSFILAIVEWWESLPEEIRNLQPGEE